MAERLRNQSVTWFEEPVSSDDLEGLRLIRDRGPAGMAIAAGEYGYDLPYFRRMLEAGAVDVLQADATRCAGITGFLQAAALAAAWGLPFSAHTSPSFASASLLRGSPTCTPSSISTITCASNPGCSTDSVIPVNGQLVPDLSASRSGPGTQTSGC